MKLKFTLQNIERIEADFVATAIRHLSLQPSIKEIDDVSYGMEKLEKISVNNELFESNKEGMQFSSKMEVN